jgi:TOMM system kinase/cyclase fusion protein
MKCPRCEHENLVGAKFCGECGTCLAAPCATCGALNPAAQKFCGECGARLAQEPPSTSPLGSNDEGLASESDLEGERRQLTVMFCDLVDSTALAERLDPEELRRVIRSYQEACAAVVARFDGHVSQYLGDGLLVYFGYPHAHEDDAQRAARAALSIIQAMADLAPTEASGTRLSVRIGIHTGLVVVGDVGAGPKHERLALGQTPNLAARLQSVAAPDTIVASAATYRLIRGLFVCHDLGVRRVKGVSTSVQVYEVHAESAARSRLEAAFPAGLTPLVGREQELALLRERWEQVREGAGHTVVLTGEAGIGKSRLVEALKQDLGSESHTRWECRCSPYHQDSALYPVIDLFRRIFGFDRKDLAEVMLAKVETVLERHRVARPESVSLWASLLSVPLPAHYPALTLSPPRQKQKTLEAVLALILASAERQPLLLIVEDLHWVDPSTLELLNLVLDQVPGAAVLTLLTCRSDWRPTWAGRPHLTQLTLNRFTRKQTEVMVERITNGKALPPEVRRQVVAKTDGVPLFVEELTKMVLESGLLEEHDGRYELSGPLPPLGIPSTLQDSLMARLDRLGRAKDLAQLAATLGRAFPHDLLRAVSRLDETTLEAEITRLVDAELLYRRRVGPQPTYIFKHALIQEAAYQALLKTKRQQYHQQIARVLTERFADTVETQPELLAYHYTEGGLPEQAISYWQRAGDRAIARSANLEAIGHLSKGLELLTARPDTPERRQLELAMQIALGVSFMATKGYAAPEVEKAYTRARELCQQVGETPQIFPVLRGLAAFYHVRAELETARELSEQLLSLASRQQDLVLLMGAHLELGSTLFSMGEFTRALEQVERGVSLYDHKRHRSHAFLYGQDLGVSCLSRAASLLAILGYPDQALKRSYEALTLARDLSHPHSVAYALHFTVLVHQLRREVQPTLELAEELIRLATEQGFPLWATAATAARAWALAEGGDVEDAIAEMRKVLESWRAVGAEISRVHFLALLAEACRIGGKFEEGLYAVAEGLALGHRTKDRWREVDLYRTQGELLLGSAGRHPRSSSMKEAEECFRRAIDIARCQQAKSFELQAVLSLGRLWDSQGRKEDARRIRAGIYGWFTEGFDTPDLKEAKSLLEGISSA